jgi:hypothetical protein
LPEVDKDIKKAIEGNNPETLLAYQRLLPFKLSRIKATIKERKVDHLLKDVEYIQGKWDEIANEPAKLAGSLPQLVQLLNQLGGRLPKEIAAREEKEERVPVAQQEAVSKQAPLQELSINDISKAIELLQANVIKSIDSNEADIMGSISLMFGDTAPQATARIREIVSLLREFSRWYSFRYQVDPRLPESQMALADRSRGIINLSKGLFKSTLPRVAAALMHEGSHLIKNPTSDFAYRRSGAHYYLPPGLALYNAANYEQVAADAVHDETFQPPENTPRSRDEVSKASPERIAITKVTAQVTLAWVIVSRMRETKVSELDSRAVKRLSLPTAQGTAPLAEALVDGLFYGMDWLNDALQKRIELSSAGEWGATKEGRSLVGLPPDKLAERNPDKLAQNILWALCNRYAEVRAVPVPADVLFDFINNAHELEPDTTIAKLISDYTGPKS